jgi:hypothetical protein
MSTSCSRWSSWRFWSSTEEVAPGTIRYCTGSGFAITEAREGLQSTCQRVRRGRQTLFSQRHVNLTQRCMLFQLRGAAGWWIRHNKLLGLLIRPRRFIISERRGCKLAATPSCGCKWCWRRTRWVRENLLQATQSKVAPIHGVLQLRHQGSEDHGRYDSLLLLRSSHSARISCWWVQHKHPP